MTKEIEKAIYTLAEKTSKAPAHEALHFSQSALNLAHTAITLVQMEYQKKQS